MSIAETLAVMPAEQLIDLVTRGLDADEETAREAGNRRWLVEDNMISLWPEDEHDGFMSWPTRADARHAYRHDPSRVLADVESRREILAEHTPERGACRTCAEPTYDPARPLDPVPAPCRTLIDLARPYLDQETP